MAEGHRKRLRSRLMNEPVESIPEYVVLESLLAGVIKRRDTCGMARALIERFGSLAAVVDAPMDDLMTVDGVGESAAHFLKCLPIFFRKYAISKWGDCVIFRDVEDVGRYVADRCIGVENERIILVCMDANMRLISCVTVAEGSINAVDVSLRKVLETALKYKAIRVVLAHTHPGGNAMPSHQDILSTEKVVQAFEVSGIQLDDHIVVAGDDYVSLRDSYIAMQARKKNG